MKTLLNKCCVEGCEKRAEFQVMLALSFTAKLKGAYHRLAIRACDTHRYKIQVSADWVTLSPELKSMRVEREPEGVRLGYDNNGEVVDKNK